MSIHGKSPLQNFSTPLLIEAMEGNLAAYIMYCSCIPGARVYREADHISALTGIPQPSLNVVMRTRFNQDNAYERIAEVMAPFKSRRVPMLWWIFPGAKPTNLARYLTLHGLTYYEDGPGMAADLRALPAPPMLPPGCTIEEVASQEELDEWIETSALAFGGTPSEIDPDYIAFERCLGWGSDQPYRRFLARLYGEPVATSAMFLMWYPHNELNTEKVMLPAQSTFQTEQRQQMDPNASSTLASGVGVVGLYSVGTLSKVQRRGIGTAISLAPLLTARSMGYTLAVLQSSSIGYNVYTRLGFREFCRVRSYLWSPSS